MGTDHPPGRSRTWKTPGTPTPLDPALRISGIRSDPSEHFNDYGVPHNPQRYQEVLNKSWPPADIARELKDRPDAVAVQVRIEFETDGEQWLDGVARRWWRQHVCVECNDPRLQVRYVWVDAGDVKRR